MRTIVLATLFAIGCNQPGQQPLPPDDHQSAGGEEPVTSGEDVQTESTQSLSDAPPLPERLEAGEIPRAQIAQVLEWGPATFLRLVKSEPHLDRGRFVGWRLVSIFEDNPELSGGVLRPGDTVLRVNGQSIERPEQFQNVWESLASSSELVIEVRRGDQASTVRYGIVDSSSR